MNSFKTVDQQGHIRWYKVGTSLLHREDGPACEYLNGSKCWYQNDKLHRLDGAAIEWRNGDKEWYVSGKAHREDGPAFEDINGWRLWYYHGERIDCETNEEFLRLIKLKAFW